MVGLRGAPPELVCRGGLPSQVSLVAPTTPSQGPITEASRKTVWVDPACRLGPEEVWRGVEDVHCVWHTVRPPVASCCLWVP